MAIIKSIDTHLGVPAAYWRITHVATDLRDNTVSFRLSGYPSEALRRDGKIQIADRDFVMEGMEDAGEVTRDQMYDFVKKQDEFKGGKKV